MTESVPDAVRAAYGWERAEITPLVGGLINKTFVVRADEIPVAVVQRLHPVFGATVNLDLDAVTRHLAARGLETPRLIFTRSGAAWIEDEGAVWRALTWIEGTTVAAVPDPSWATVAGELVGKFHRAVADLDHTYAFARAGVHDTKAHLKRLRAHLEATDTGFDRDGDARALASEILDVADTLPVLPDLPRRHCHGDLKISNVLFAQSGSLVRARCLVDLDTLGLGTLAFELGDAMRSWCNPRGEDAGPVGFDLAIFAAAIGGFRSVADTLVTRDERLSIVTGLETVCVELAARFATDVFRDEYFGWDASRFPTRRAHNLVRARGQLALAAAVRAVRSDAREIVLAGT
ncbi:MAG TPA: phosphotransferase [Kofleriaceae bacterium]